MVICYMLGPLLFDLIFGIKIKQFIITIYGKYVIKSAWIRCMFIIC